MILRWRSGWIARGWMLEPADRLRVLIEVRVAEEETKSGVSVAELPELAEKWRCCRGWNLRD